MSSNFNLSTLAAMQEQRVEQVSVHFWRCQLTREQPRFDWRPDQPEPSREEKNGSEAKSEKNGGENGKSSEPIVEEVVDDHDNCEGVTRHLLHVTGCVLAPKAAGIHLVTVRTQNTAVQKQMKEKQKEDAEVDQATPAVGTPILCIDPAMQRTLALSHEFVLETGADLPPQTSLSSATASSCTFELAEGDGPVWLTGTHRVHRVVSLVATGEDDDDEEEEAEEDEEDAEAAGEEEEDIDEEMDEEEEEEEEVEEEEEEEGKKPKRAKAAAAVAKKPAAKKGQQQLKQKQQAAGAGAQAEQRRKRSKPDS